MSMRSLESAILRGARRAFANSKLRLKDIQEWNTGEIKPQDGEVTLYILDPGVYVTVKKECDKRKGVE